MRSRVLVVSVVLCSLGYHETRGAEAGPRDLHQLESPESPQETRQRIVNAIREQSSKVEVSNTELVGQMVVPQICYSCVDCPVVTNDTEVKMCPFKNSNCVKYAESYSFAEKPIYIRGCVTDRGTCNDIKKAHTGHKGIRLVSCNECTGTRCNGATRSDLTAAVMFLIAMPLVKKYAFS